ncbi:MAG: substrate-binding domain-containing protein [Anaerolineales bacterium]|nr:substrate-binding domain-containing protein [Anaerolineales bacterium]
MSIGQLARPGTIGLLGSGLVNTVQNQLWQGAVKAAQEQGVRLVYYPAISLSSIPPFDPQSKVLFDLVDARYVDGLLVWYAGIAEGIGIDRGESVLERYKDIPLVTIGGGFKNYPNLSIDNYRGVYSAVEHLIKVHNYQNIAIVRGPIGHPDADERYRAYADALQAYSIPINPEYVAQSLFELTTAYEMTEKVIAQWFDDSHLKIDAIVASSDYIAFGVIKAIESRGLHVPEDIAVVGFDGVDDAQANIPSITTVYQSFYELGRQGVEMLLNLLGGQNLPAQSIMSAPLLVGESCGCIAKSLSLSNTELESHPKSDRSDSNIPEGGVPVTLTVVAQDLKIPLSELENLSKLFKSDLTSKTSNQFLSALRQSLIQTQSTHFDAIAWQNAISVLRQQELSNGDIGWLGETLFNQARVLVTEIHQRVFIRQQLKIKRQVEKLMQTSETLITSFGEQLFVDTLYERLPELGFPSFYLSLYDDPDQPAMWSHILLAYDNGKRLDLPPDKLQFPTGRLFPECVHPAHSVAPIVVEPLYFRNERQGLLVLEVGPMEGVIYENLRAQISSALQGSRLTQQVLTRTHQLESANKELEAFSYSISHDLRAPLRAIDGFSRMLMDDHASVLPTEVVRLLGIIRNNTHQMGRLIDDLLTFSRLSRQPVNKQVVNTVDLVKQVMETLQIDAEKRKVEIKIEELPICQGDPILLKQVWMNLVSNAVKFTRERDIAQIQIGCIQENGEQVFFVKDNGAGFDMRYANKLFGVFQRLHHSDKFEGTGVGLAIVQRIILRHEGRIWVEAEPNVGATFFFTIQAVP